MSRQKQWCDRKHTSDWLSETLSKIRSNLSKTVKNAEQNDTSIPSTSASRNPCNNSRSKKSRKVQNGKGRSDTRKCNKTRDRSDSKHQDDSSELSDENRASKRPIANVNNRLQQCTFFLVLNTGYFMDQGTAASALYDLLIEHSIQIARGFLALYNKLDHNTATIDDLEDWEKAGQKIVVLKGYNHRHLRFLESEVHHLAIDSYSLCRTWGRGRVILVLASFGREEDMEEILENLEFLR